MLTKEERKEIAERLSSVTELGDRAFYEAITGEQRPDTTSYEEDLKAMFNVVINLCDTSNMIELPVDKDGIPFKKGDTVYESDGTEHKVDGYAFTGCDTKILSVVDPINNAYVVLNSDELAHKKPVTIASLVGEIRRTLSQNTIMNKEATSKLWEITDQIEMLSDSDD